MKQEVQIVPLSRVHADVDQPRKMFGADRMADLISSITKHGIMNPLIVEKDAEGYMLVDGERRFRAAKELKLKEIPVIVVAANSPTERLIQQFHLQEQHEGWSPIEKANAVGKLSKAMKMNMEEIGKILGIPSKTIANYVSFSELINKKEFERSELPISYSRYLHNLRTYLRRSFEAKDREFTVDDESDFELAVISRIKRGDIKKPTDLNKIRDASRLSLDKVMKFIKDEKITVQRLYLDADAKVASHYRNFVYACRAINMHAEEGIGMKMASFMTDGDITLLKKAEKNIKAVIGSR